jgi:predicted ribosome quality control (RQC) complex YloA/Tae2 family protein
MKLEIIFVQGLNRYIHFYIGKSKEDNFEVINKGNENDLWFHAKGTSSCHVIGIIPDDIKDKNN